MVDAVPKVISPCVIDRITPIFVLVSKAFIEVFTYKITNFPILTDMVSHLRQVVPQLVPTPYFITSINNTKKPEGGERDYLNSHIVVNAK